MSKQAFEGVARLTGFLFPPEELVIVGLDVDKDDEEGHLHFLYDERVELPLREDFVLNVLALGVKKPVLVTKVGNEAYVVDGRQRVRAAREANTRLAAMGEPLIRVPCVQQKGDEPLIMVVGVATNEFNTEDTPLAKARKAQRLRDRGLSEDEIATAFGVSGQTLANWSSILSLSAPVQKAVAQGKVSASAAAKLRDLPASEQKAQLDSLVSEVSEGKKPTAQQVHAAASKAAGKDAPQPPSKRVLRFLVEKPQDHGLPGDFVAGVAFALGRLDPTKVKGLQDALQLAKKAPAKKRA